MYVSRKFLSERCANRDAARSYFTSHFLEGSNRKYKDGGTFAQNSSVVALAESRAIMSGRRNVGYRDHRPDYILSLGTGYVDGHDTEEPAAATEPGDDLATIRRAFREGGIGQMLGFLNSTLCGHTQALEFEAANPDLLSEGRYFRFDLPLSRLPKLDDAGAIPKMKNRAERFFSHSPHLRALEQVMVSTSFYFEPMHADLNDDCSYYTLSGAVLCRRKKGHEHFDAFCRSILDLQASVVVADTELLPCQVDAHGNLSRPIQIQVESLNGTVSIQLRTASGSTRHISGSPFDVKSVWETLYYRRMAGPVKRRVDRKSVV